MSHVLVRSLLRELRVLMIDRTGSECHRCLVTHVECLLTAYRCAQRVYCHCPRCRDDDDGDNEDVCDEVYDARTGTARAGQAGAEFEWGDEFRPDGQWRANSWQGPFPAIDTGDDGFAGLAPTGCFEPNALGLVDMTGNVWEWTSRPFSTDPATGTIRGGSYLCAPNFCARFRPSARQAQEWDFSASHIGFRTISRDPAPALP